MTTETPARFIRHDTNLLGNRPVDPDQWDAAWRLATDHPVCIEPVHDCIHAELVPQLRWAAAQVGSCRVRHGNTICNGALIPIAQAHTRQGVRYLESRCLSCGAENTDHDQLTRRTPTAGPAYTPGGAR